MRLFIGCTSKTTIDSAYIEMCSPLIKELASIPDISLVYGAWNEGIMGVLYEEFSKNKRNIIGVTTEFHKNLENDIKLYEEIVVKTTTERFQKIHECSDVLLFLPGGLGTYAEIFSAIEEHRIHNGKKIILYNVNSFYTNMIQELYKLHKMGFIDEVPADYMIIESEWEKIVDIIKEEK